MPLSLFTIKARLPTRGSLSRPPRSRRRAAVPNHLRTVRQRGPAVSLRHAIAIGVAGRQEAIQSTGHG